jgi:chromosomal replication initiation ATPase DnaA
MPAAELWGDSQYRVLEDIETLRDETALFHLLRHVETQGAYLLMSANAGAAQLPFTLPDVCSRLRAAAAIALSPPDELLLQGFLMKYFSDRQLRVGEDVISYLAKRTERSFAGAHVLAEQVERSSTQAKREITIPFVRSLMDNSQKN